MFVSKMESFDIIVEKSVQVVNEIEDINSDYITVNNRKGNLKNNESYGGQDKLRDYHCHAGESRPCRTRREMITENTLLAEEKMRHVDDVSMNLSNNSHSYEDLFIPETGVRAVNETEKFTEPIDRPTFRTGIGILMDLPLKIMNGVSDLLNFQSSPSPESEIPAKRPYSPKPHHAKQTPTDIARGRGRGRGRSQLRRSGVSQTRHRQERIRQRLSADIRDDLNGLGEFQDQNIEDEVPSTPCVDENGQRIRYSADGPEAEPGASRFPFSVGFCNMKRKKPKQRNKQGGGNGDRRSISDNCKVRYIPERVIDAGELSDDEGTESGRMRRRSLQSDISVDSEDSYCIVFENGSELDYETDYRYTTEDDEDDDSDDDCGEMLKAVRFSPHPVIHTMIAWNYAYRAARKGPWEEMARDRERFKYRINCIARVLDPVLVPQHRSEIWQHRFAVQT